MARSPNGRRNAVAVETWVRQVPAGRSFGAANEFRIFLMHGEFLFIVTAAGEAGAGRAA
jgi:hypothetical protein